MKRYGPEANAWVDFQVEVDLRTVVKLADRFSVALAALVLGINLVVDGGGQRGKAVCTVRADDVGFNGSIAGIGDVDDCIRQGIVLRVEDLAEKQAADDLFFFVGRGAGNRAQRHNQGTDNGYSLDHRAVVIHPVYCLTVAACDLVG